MTPRILLAAAALAWAAAAPLVQGAPSASGAIARALADPGRPAGDRALDARRKPAEMLAFAGIRPGETVGEYLPGGGYYTRMLSDVVGPRGKVYALETSTWGQDNVDATKAVLKEPHRGNVSVDVAPLGEFHMPAKVDVVWITDNYHDLHISKYAKVDMAAFNRAVFAALKPGGEYFIIDHAAAAGTGAKLSPQLHRIDEATVIAEVTAAGFKLAGESQALRNPADDHTKSVFDPALHFSTDQFVLRFRKP